MGKVGMVEVAENKYTILHTFLQTILSYFHKDVSLLRKRDKEETPF